MEDFDRTFASKTAYESEYNSLITELTSNEISEARRKEICEKLIDIKGKFKIDNFTRDGIVYIENGKAIKNKEEPVRECKHDWSQPNIDKMVARLKDGKTMDEVSKEFKIPHSQISGKLTELGLNKRKLLANGEVKISIEQRVIKEVKDAGINWIGFTDWLKKHFGYESCAAIQEYDMNVIRLYIENAKKTRREFENGTGLIQGQKSEQVKKKKVGKYDWSDENIARIEKLSETMSLNEIEKETGIPAASINERFKRLGKSMPWDREKKTAKKVDLSPELAGKIKGVKTVTRRAVETSTEERIPVGDGSNVIVKVNVVEGETQVLIHIPTIHERR